jgi:hypothetical protein
VFWSFGRNQRVRACLHPWRFVVYWPTRLVLWIQTYCRSSILCSRVATRASCNTIFLLAKAWGANRYFWEASLRLDTRIYSMYLIWISYVIYWGFWNSNNHHSRSAHITSRFSGVVKFSWQQNTHRHSMLVGRRRSPGDLRAALVGIKKWRECPWQISETVLFVLLLRLLNSDANAMPMPMPMQP